MGWWTGTLIYSGVYALSSGVIHVTGRTGTNGWVNSLWVATAFLDKKLLYLTCDHYAGWSTWCAVQRCFACGTCAFPHMQNSSTLPSSALLTCVSVRATNIRKSTTCRWSIMYWAQMYPFMSISPILKPVVEEHAHWHLRSGTLNAKRVASLRFKHADTGKRKLGIRHRVGYNSMCVCCWILANAISCNLSMVFFVSEIFSFPCLQNGVR